MALLVVFSCTVHWCLSKLDAPPCTQIPFAPLVTYSVGRLISESVATRKSAQFTNFLTRLCHLLNLLMKFSNKLVFSSWSVLCFVGWLPKTNTKLSFETIESSIWNLNSASGCFWRKICLALFLNHRPSFPAQLPIMCFFDIRVMWSMIELHMFATFMAVMNLHFILDPSHHDFSIKIILLAGLAQISSIFIVPFANLQLFFSSVALPWVGACAPISHG